MLDILTANSSVKTFTGLEGKGLTGEDREKAGMRRSLEAPKTSDNRVSKVLEGRGKK